MTKPPLLATLLAACLSTPAAAGTCALMPEVLAVKTPCAQGRMPREACVWIPMIEDLFAGRMDSLHGRLIADFGVSPAVAQRLVASAASVVLVMADDASCSADEFLDLTARVMATGPLEESARRDGNGFASIWVRVMDLDPRVKPRLAAEVGRGELARPEAARAFDGFCALLERSGLKDDYLRKAFAENPTMAGLLAEGAVPVPARVSEGLAAAHPALGAVDRNLALAGRGDLAAARREIEALAENLPARERGLVFARAGWGFLQLSRHEDGLAMLQRAEETLSSSPRSDLEARYVRLLAASLRAEAARTLGLPAEAAPEEPDLAAGQRLLGQIFARARNAKQLEALGLGLVRDLLSGRAELATLEPMFRAFELSMPSLGNFGGTPPGALPTGPPPPGVSMPLFQIYEKLMLGRDAEAFELWQENVKRNPHLLQVLGSMLIATAARKRGDFEGAIRALQATIDLLERHLASHRLDETSRAFFDLHGADTYLATVDLLAVEGRSAEAFAMAERARGFTLRRQLLERRVPGRPSAAERSGILAATRLERSGLIRGERLNEIYRRFAEARFERELREAGGAPPAMPGPLPLDTLQHALGPGETLVAFHPGLEGRLFAWRITRDQLDLQVLKLPPPGQVACLAQKLRWQAPITATRGAEVLDPCPGLPAGQDPAALLHQTLIAPFAARLGGTRRLIVVPHGEIHGVPFAALRDADGRRLLASFDVAVAMSAGALVRLRRAKPLPVLGPKPALPRSTHE